MLKHGKVLIIEENIEKRNKLKIIFDFIGEPCVVVSSKKMDDINSLNWSAVFLGIHADIKSIESNLSRLQEKGVHAPVIIYGNDELLHSFDNAFRTKIIGKIETPLSYEKVLKALHFCQISNESHPAKSTSSPIGLFHDLVGNTQSIQKIRHLVEQVASSDANVLIIGESGTGKEIAAKSIHNQSKRKGKPFIPINCGAIPADLLESELFGHEKGAFTGALSSRQGRFELANTGTLFLDEIGDMPLNMQVKLLRVLQEKCFERVGCNKTIKVDVRIIAATHHNLEKLIEEGKFREDLYYRLNVFPIKMPALRDRADDIPLLINELSLRMTTNNAPVAKFIHGAMTLLKDYSWPGNVRELANLVERMSILYPNGVIGMNELPKRFKPKNENFSTLTVRKMETNDDKEEKINFLPHPEVSHHGIDLKKHLVETELTLITQALEETNWVVAKAADFLNMRRTTLVEKMKKYDISRPVKAV